MAGKPAAADSEVIQCHWVREQGEQGLLCAECPSASAIARLGQMGETLPVFSGLSVCITTQGSWSPAAPYVTYAGRRTAGR